MPDAKLLPDRFEKFPQPTNDGVEAWIYSSFQKDLWQARLPGDQFHAEHPGTAIRVGDDVYEIFKMEETGVGGYLVRYGLKKWDAQHAIRKVIPYTEESKAAALAEHVEQADIRGLRQTLVWTFLFAGLAPDPVQRRWEMKSGVNMVLVSMGSAMGMFAIYISLNQLFGESLNALGVANGALTYLGLESLLRIVWIFSSGQPHGTLVLTAPYILYEAVFHPERREKKAEWVKTVMEEDKVIWRGAEHLLVNSMLFDEMLAGSDPVRIEGTVWRPLNWHEEGKGLKRCFVYEFGRMEPEGGKRVREYTRPRAPLRQKAVEDYTRRRDRAHIFALVWGLYPAAEQTRLENEFHFPAAFWTAVTAGFFIVGALFQAWIFATGSFPLPAYLVPAYWALESLYRLYRAKSQGQPAGSLVGYVLALVVHPPDERRQRQRCR
jgi:hypothetical protein